VTTVGYAGGETPNPSYYKLGDHKECVDIYFDPCVTSYSKILELFWRSHDPTVKTSSQYSSIILTHNLTQATLATQSLQGQTKRYDTKVLTRQVEFYSFHRAEEKHQKNQLRRHPALLACLRWEKSLSASYVATRLNGYVGGHGAMDKFNKEWELLGLNKDMAAYVRSIIIKRY